MSGVSPNSELGDLAAFCVDCGWTRRYLPEIAEPPTQCPACSGEVISACRECGAGIRSAMATMCEECDAELRAPMIGDMRIRRVRRLPMA